MPAPAAELLAEELRILEGCLERDPAAWEELVRRYGRLVYGTIYRVLRTRGGALPADEVEDVHNEVFLGLLERKLACYQGRQGCSLRSWIRLVTVTTTINYVASRRGRSADRGGAPAASAPSVPAEELLGSVPDPSPGPDAAAIGEEERRIFLELVEELSPREQLYLKLSCDRELPTDRIARMLGVSVPVVHQMKSRLTKRLREAVLSRQAM
jgi:RNA polymerase sigma factor (sigma-70 family)